MLGILSPKKVYSYLIHHLKRVWSQLQTVKTLFLPYGPFVLTDVGVHISLFFIFPWKIWGTGGWQKKLLSISLLFTQNPADKKSRRSAHSVVMVRKAKRDTDRTSESECDSGKENRRQTRIPKYHDSVTSSTTTKETKRSERWFCTKRDFWCHVSCFEMPSCLHLDSLILL